MRQAALFSGLVVVLAIGLSGIGTATGQESPAKPVHPPMPVPDMPVPDGRRLEAPPPAPSLPAAPAPLLGPAPLAPALTDGFSGLDDPFCSGVDCVIPPDTHGAVGPNHLMEVLNTEVQVQDRNGTVLWGPVDLDTFWAPVNGGGGTFDPRVHYDPYADRWITVAVDDAQTSTSALLIAVSQTADPTGAWHFHSIEADAANVDWADYPTVGFNGKWIVVQVNLFPISGSLLSRSHIFVFDRTASPGIYDGVFSPILFSLDGATYGGTQVPAATYDPLEPDLYLLQRWNGDVLGQGYLRLYRLTGPANAPVLDWLDPLWQWVVSPNPWEGSGGGNTAPQIEPPVAVSGCANCTPGTCLILANDDRIQNLVMRNGTLWTTQTVFLPAGTPTRSSVQWWQIATDTTVLQRGRVDDPTASRHFAFPSIAVNVHEDVLLGYSSFEGSQYASGSYSFRTAFDPPDTMQPESILKDGQACYYKDFGTGRNRWGDYSATIVDPTDDTKLWTLQEYATLPDPARPSWAEDGWGTWWGMLDTTRTITIADASGPEGDSPTTPLTFTLTLSAPSAAPVTVEWSTQDGTATLADSDYVQVLNDVVTFAPGTTTQTLTVDIWSDSTWEGDETVFVNLANPQNAVIADNQAMGVILNDDPQISISDVQRIEGDGGSEATDFIFTVSLSNPSPTPVTVDWLTVDDTAVAGALGTGDFTFASGPPLSFTPGTVKQDIVIKVHGDLDPEPLPAPPPPYEVFFVDLTGGSGGSIIKARGVGRIVDDDAVNPAPVGLAIVADSVGSGASDGRTRLQWMNPADADGYVVRWNREVNCPTLPANPTGGTSDGTTDVTTPLAAGSTTTVTYSTPGTPLNLDELYCYRVWLKYPGPTYSAGVRRDARPYDSAGTRVKWKVFSGVSLLAQPTVGFGAVLAPGNDQYLHAMTRGAAGGTWPVLWRPRDLGAVSQQRAPIVPLGGGWRMFISTQDGRVHSIDTATGNPVWSTQLPEGAAQGAPAGIFTAFGGAYDYILVGTSSGTGDRLYALDPLTGAVIDAFPQAIDGLPGTPGAILGMPTVDYGSSRVYFASRIGTLPETVWCLELGPPSDALRLGWRKATNDINGSAVLHNGRVLVGTISSEVFSFSEDDGSSYSLPLGDGPIKGFLFPDRRGNDLYVATDGKVWAVTDTGSGLNTSKWATEPSLVNPSVVLHHPGTDDIYVGVDDDGFGFAAIVKINASTGAIVSSVALENLAVTIGPPSLDLGPPGMLHVGSVAGILYAVELGF